MNRTPRRILIGLYERNENGVCMRSEATVIYSHTGKEFILFNEKTESKLLKELTHYLLQLLPKQTVVPGKIGLFPWAEPGEKTLRIFVELENSLTKFLKMDFDCRIGDGYCLVEMDKYSQFSRDEHQGVLNALTRLKDTPVIFKSDLRDSSSRWSEITILQGEGAYILNRCITKSGLDLTSELRTHANLQEIADRLQPLEANFTKAAKYTGADFDLFGRTGVCYSFSGIRWEHYEQKTYQQVSTSKGCILHTADDTWQTNLRYDDSIQMLGPLVSGLSGTHLFEGECLNLGMIGSSRYS